MNKDLQKVQPSELLTRVVTASHIFIGPCHHDLPPLSQSTDQQWIASHRMINATSSIRPYVDLTGVGYSPIHTKRIAG